MFYILEGVVPVKVAGGDPRAIALFADSDARTVALTEPHVDTTAEVNAKLMSGRLASVSTVFLVLDHNHFGGGPPILFETMIFGEPNHGYQARYESAREALAGHYAACKKAGIKEKARLGAIERALQKVSN